MRTGAGAWLDACAEPEVQQIVLLDAPAVLGWERWREIGMRHGMGLVEGVLGHAMEVGRVRRQPLRPLAHMVVGALDEVALYVARADDPVTAGREARAVVDQLIDGFAVDASTATYGVVSPVIRCDRPEEAPAPPDRSSACRWSRCPPRCRAGDRPSPACW